MSPRSVNSYGRGDQVDGLFAESDEELEAALSQELIELAGPDQHPQTEYPITRLRPKADT